MRRWLEDLLALSVARLCLDHCAMLLAHVRLRDGSRCRSGRWRPDCQLCNRRCCTCGVGSIAVLSSALAEVNKKHQLTEIDKLVQDHALWKDEKVRSLLGSIHQSAEARQQCLDLCRSLASAGRAPTPQEDFDDSELAKQELDEIERLHEQHDFLHSHTYVQKLRKTIHRDAEKRTECLAICRKVVAEFCGTPSREHAQPVHTAAAGPSSSSHPTYTPAHAKADAEEQLRQVPNLSEYRNFVTAFGNTDGVSFPRLQKIINSFSAFTNQNRLTADLPPQPICIGGMERQGKTPAIEYCTKIALGMNMAVLIGVAPTKVAPVKDMRGKLAQSGFRGITTTLAPNQLDRDYPNSSCAHIMIFAITTPTDIKKARGFVNDHMQQGRRTIVILDECDELTMGKGRSKMQHDINVFSHFDGDPPSDSDDSSNSNDSDDSDLIYDHEDDGDSRDRKTWLKDVAESEKLIAELLQPKCLLVLVTATFSACYLKYVGFFRKDEEMVTIRIRDSPGYAGVMDMEVPYGCDLSRKSKLNDFTPTSPVGCMLKHWLDGSNPSDGTTIHHRIDPAKTLKVKGSLFISITSRVGASGGAFDIAKNAMHFVKENYAAMFPRVLFICFVGYPRAYICGEEYELPECKGASLEDMVDCMRTRLDVDDFDRICFIGWNLTRRAMTGTFVARGCLYTPMYAVVHFPQGGKIDADSQRLLRAGHDFNLFIKPDNYKIGVCCIPKKLDELKHYRKFENEALADNEENPKTFKDFIDSVEVRKHALEHKRVGKRNQTMRHFGVEEPEAKRRKQISHLYVGPYKEWLVSMFEVSTSERYADGLSRVIEQLGEDWLAEIRGMSNDHIQEIAENVCSSNGWTAGYARNMISGVTHFQEFINQRRSAAHAGGGGAGVS